MLKIKITALIFFLFSFSAIAQINLTDDLSQIDYSSPKEYEIGGITVTGVANLDNNVLISISGLSVGEKIKIPGEKISDAIEKIWKQGLFETVKITATKIQGNIIFLNIDLLERPRLTLLAIHGVRKGEANTIHEEIKLTRGDVVTDNVIMRAKNSILKKYIDKGFLNTEVDIIKKKDTAATNSMIVNIEIHKNHRVKIHKINFTGNANITDGKLKRTLKKTKQKELYRIFATSRYIDEDYKADKIKLIDKYNEFGYRDAEIVWDSVYKYDSKTVNVDMEISEGKKYYFRNITWVGNTKYKDEDLFAILRIKKGDVYNQKVLESNLDMNPDGKDIRSLYMDDGYLFFQVQPVELAVDKDSIDIEIRIYEGKQATINKVMISGNVKTNDHVILREIRTKPGMLFSRADIIRSQRELAQLRYFDAEKIQINPIPNPVDGTVDIEYVVEETSSDQLELSGGWGAGSLVGTLGVSFNNFSGRNIFKKGAWRPLPSGDGQKLSVRAQSNGLYYQSYNASFTEPWLGGKKPNALSFSVYHSVQSNGISKKDPTRQSITIDGVSVGLGKRLKWPDDFFTLYQEVSYQNYNLKNYASTFSFSNGRSNNLDYSITLGRSSIDAPIYPRTGSELSLSMAATPPYSYLDKLLGHEKNIATLTDQEKYKWIEYHKWKFSASWFTKLAGNLVLNTRSKFGFLGLYNKEIGSSPFERFYLGGDGLSGFALDGREIIALRGYGNNTLTPRNASSNFIGGTIFNKYTIELRYPISLSPMATVYLLGFAEAGNCWLNFSEFNPFDVKRSAGAGVRIYLPMFGLLGLDWGYGFDAIPGLPSANKGQFHFSINQSID